MNSTTIRFVSMGLVLFSSCAVLALESTARAAALFPGHAVIGETVAETLQRASRWSSASGLSDGIQVAVMPGFAEAMGAINATEVALIEGVVTSAFEAWANPALQFDITFDGAAVIDSSLGFEFDLFALPESSFVFGPDPPFGSASVFDQFILSRPLTNGQVFDGWAIAGADVYINIDKTAAFADLFSLTEEEKLASLGRLLMHEIGHGLGLHHSNVATLTNYDTDNDPLNAMAIDPLDPFANVISSSFRDTNAIMSNDAEFSSLFQTFLSNDDLGGRDLLYPVVPEPNTMFLACIGATVVVGWQLRRRRQRKRQ